MTAGRPSPSTGDGRLVHLIPEDGLPHAETSECGCGPQPVTCDGRRAYRHCTPDEPVMGD